MAKLDKIAKYHRNTDVRAELIAADAIESGIRLGNISIRPVGISKRTYSRDVLKLDLLMDQSGMPSQMHLDVSREGIYDMLPEGLFHQPDPDKRSMKVHDLVEEIKRSRKEEEDARKFFFPIEKEINRQRILIEVEERKSYEDYSDHYKNQLFFKLWPELTELRKEYINPLVKVLPRSCEIAGRLDKTEYCFRKVLGVDLTLIPGEPFYSISPTTEKICLGDIMLGADSCLGNCRVDVETAIHIVIGPIRKSQLTDFLPNGQAFKVLRLLQKYFLPMECSVNLEIVLKKEEEVLILSDSQTDGVLGITSRI